MLKDPSEIKGAYADNRTAEEYIDKRFVSPWGSVLHASQVKVVNDAIREHGVRRLLEIAPGPARLSREVSGFERGYLCEFNESMVQVARQRLAHSNGRWTVVRGDAFRLPFAAPAGLDMVYTFRFIRHFEAAERTALYTQVHSVLKDGGLFVFDAVNAKIRRDNPEQYPIYDVMYEPDALKSELQQHGFTPLMFVGVIQHMWLQYRIQILVAPRSDALARLLIRGLERLRGEPLEWVVVAQKTGTGTRRAVDGH